MNMLLKNPVYREDSDKIRCLNCLKNLQQYLSIEIETDDLLLLLFTMMKNGV